MPIQTATAKKKDEAESRLGPLALLFLLFSCSCIFCSSQAALMSVTQERINASMLSRDMADYYEGDEIVFAPLKKTIIEDVVQDEVRAEKTPLPLAPEESLPMVAQPAILPALSPTALPLNSTIAESAQPIPTMAENSSARPTDTYTTPPDRDNKPTPVSTVSKPNPTAPPVQPTPPPALPTVLPTPPVLVTPVPTIPPIPTILPIPTIPTIPPTIPPLPTVPPVIPTPKPKSTSTPTPSPTFTPSPTSSFTPSPSATSTPTLTPTPSPSATAWPSPTATVVPIIQFNPVTYLAYEAQGSILLTVTLSAPANITTSTRYVTVDNTALAGQDYQAQTGLLTFAPGQTVQTFTIPIINDSEIELDETFKVILTETTQLLGLENPTSHIYLPLIKSSFTQKRKDANMSRITLPTSSPLSVFAPLRETTPPIPATVTIISDDEPTIQFSQSHYQVNENSGAALLTVTLDLTTPWPLTVNYTALSMSGTLTFAPSQMVQTFTLPISDDHIAENDHAVNLLLSRPPLAQMAYRLIPTATLTIIDDDGLPEVQFAQAQYFVNESELGAPMTVTLSMPAEFTTSINYTILFTDSTATPDLDYQPVRGTLTFAPFITMATFIVPIIDDRRYENNEFVILQLDSPTKLLLGNPATTTLTMVDNDPRLTVQLSNSQYQAHEDDGAAIITATLNQPAWITVTVDYWLTNSANQTTISGTLIFPPESLTASYHLPITDDQAVTGDQTFILTLDHPQNGLLGVPTTATLTIFEDDTFPTIQFGSANYQTAESGGAIAVQFTLNKPPFITATVTYQTLNGTALANLDYVPISGTLIFAPGQTTATISMPIIDDAIDEPNKNFSLQLLTATHALIAMPATTMTIIDEDSRWAQFDSPTYTIDENGGQLNLTVRLNQSAVYPVSVQANSRVLTAPYIITFSPGQTIFTLTLPIIDDPLPEPTETFTVTLSHPVSMTLGTPTSVLVTVLDNDTPAVQLTHDNYRVAENGGQVTLTATLSFAVVVPLTITYHTTDGTAMAGRDYPATLGTLTFAAGQTNHAFTIPISDNLLTEPNRDFSITLNLPLSATFGLTPSATITILDDDTPTVQFAQNSYTVTESAGAVGLLVTLSKVVSNTVAVGYHKINGTAISSDYDTASGILTFAPLQISQLLSVTIINDALIEPDETFAVALDTPTNGTLGSSQLATVTIKDDDLPTVQLQTSTSTINEGVGTTTLNVSLSQSSFSTITVNYATSNLTALSGSDYNSSNGILTFALGETAKTVTVAIIDDTLDELNENFAVALSAPSQAILGTTKQTIVTITDNDIPAINLSSPTYTVGEGAGQATIMATLTMASISAVTVNYATSNGTATSGSDYSSSSGILTFLPGATMAIFNIPIINDNLAELNETFTVALSNPNSNAILGTTPTAVVTIIDNDKPVIQFSSKTYTVTEGMASLTITATLNRQATYPVAINYATTNDTATAPSDYLNTSNTLTFAPFSTVKTFTISITDDLFNELPEIFTVTLSSPSPSDVTIDASNPATVTILDDDVPQITFLSSTQTISEDVGAVLLTVTLDITAMSPVTVDYQTYDGTAFGGSDYAPLSNTLIFTPHQAVLTLTIPISDDGVAEWLEWFDVQLSNPSSNATLGLTDSTTIMIVDNEVPTLFFATNNFAVMEGSSVLPMVLLVPAVPYTITVNYQTINDTALDSADFITTSGILTFAPGDTSQTFAVSITNDAIIESLENFTVVLSSPAPTATLDITDAASITIFDSSMSTLQFITSNFKVGESGGSLPITVTLNPPYINTVTVTYTISDGTALNGQDYTATSGTLTFAPGQTSQTFTVTITDDSLIEGDQIFNLMLSSPAPMPTVTLGSLNSAIVTIIDDDPPLPECRQVIFTPTVTTVASQTTMALSITNNYVGGITFNPRLRVYRNTNEFNPTISGGILGSSVTRYNYSWSLFIPTGNTQAVSGSYRFITTPPTDDDMFTIQYTVAGKGCAYSAPVTPPVIPSGTLSLTITVPSPFQVVNLNNNARFRATTIPFMANNTGWVNFQIRHVGSGVVVWNNTDYASQYCAFGGSCNRPSAVGFDWSALTNGTYQLIVTARDSGGNTAMNSQYFVINGH